MKGHHVKLLIDTGASISCVSVEFIARLKLLSKITFSNQDAHQFKSVNGETLNSLGQVELPVKIQGLILYHTFMVFPNLFTPVILGLDFLSANNAQINLKDKSLTLKDGMACIAMVNKIEKNAIARTKSKVVIPAKSQCIVPLHIKKCEAGTTFMLQPVERLIHKYNIVGSKCVINPKKDIVVPYLLVNPTKEAVTMPANTVVASLNPVSQLIPYDCPAAAAAAKKPSKSSRSRSPVRVAQSLGIDFSASDLTNQQKQQLLHLIGTNRNAFAVDSSELGSCDLHLHRIETGDAKPISQRFYRQTPKIREETRRQIKQMLRDDIIEPSTSPWHAPVILVKKPNGTYRFATDFRKLNEVTETMVFPLPRIDDLMDSIGESKATVFSSLDLRSGFHQLKLDPETAHKTGFITPEAIYQYKRLPFGMKNSTASFQMVMSQVFRSMTYKNVLVYVDDLLVYSKDFGTHLNDLQEVFTRLQKANLKLSPEKCTFAAKTIKFLGHIISKNGISVNPEKTKALVTYPVPKQSKDVRSFLGSCNYFRRFIKNYAARAAPLNKLLKQDSKFEWTQDCQTAFDDLKTALTSPPVLAYPDFDKKFSLSTDASGFAIGFVLEQSDEQGRMKPVAYGGRALRPHEINYPITQLECLAVVEGIKCYHHFLASGHFDVYTDHAALKWLQNTKLSSGRLARWSLQLQGYSFSIFHRPGKQNQVADALSRRQYTKEDETVPDKSDFVVAGMVNHSEQECNVQAMFEYAHEVNDLCAELPIGAVYHAPDSSQFNEFTIAAVKDDLETAQRTSNDFKDIIRYLEERELPADQKVANRIIAESQYYIIVDNILYHLYYHGSKGVPKGERLVRQLAVPESYRIQALEAYHDALAGGGHAGIERTYHNLRLKYYWPRMYKDVYEHVHTCAECQAAKRDYKGKKAPLHPLPITDIFNRWHIDILGPLPETADKEKYVLVLVDSFTKWCEAYPLKSQSSFEIKKCLFDTFARFGAPECIVSDRGANFLSKMVAALCELFQVKRVCTSSYHPQSNSAVERMNGIIAQGIRTYLDKHQDKWSTYLPGVLMAHRATPATQSTKFSPYFLVFGREMTLPLDVELKPKESLGKDVQQHLKEIIGNVEEAREIAKANMEKAQKRYKYYYDRNVKTPSYATGDQVLVYNPHVPKGNVSKLWKKWTGPYYITQEGPNHTYKLRLCADNKPLTALVHANRLKPYFGRQSLEAEAEDDAQSGTDGEVHNPVTSQSQSGKQATQPQQVPDTQQNQNRQQAEAQQNQWHEVDKIIACKRKGKDMWYRIKWVNTPGTEWINGQDLNEVAKQEFHKSRTASGRQRKRPLKRHKFFK